MMNNNSAEDLPWLLELDVDDVVAGQSVQTHMLPAYQPNNFSHEYGLQQNAQVQYADNYVLPDAVHSGSLSVDQTLPITESWPGDFNFEVHFSDSEDKTKQTPWTYSSELKKLFVNIDKACPVKFTLNPGHFDYSLFSVETYLVYAKAEDAVQPVERCVNHKSGSKKIGDIFGDHILRCDLEMSTYGNSNGRFVVGARLESPRPGTDGILRHYRFMCLNSCIGGINRRPLILVFNLMLNDHPVGRKTVPVRICSCPGRDKQSEENKQKPQNEAGSTAIVNLVIPPPPQRGKRRRVTETAQSTAVKPERVTQTDVNGNEFIDIRVYGRENFDTVEAMVERLNTAYFELTELRKVMELQQKAIELQQIKEEPDDVSPQ